MNEFPLLIKIAVTMIPVGLGLYAVGALVDMLRVVFVGLGVTMVGMFIVLVHGVIEVWR
jgi:hypothetical protein